MSDESRLAVLEKNVEILFKQYEEIQESVAKTLNKMGALVEKHDNDIYNTPGLKADIRVLNEDRAERKKMFNMIQAAIIAAVLEPVLLGVFWWVTFGHKMLTTVGAK